MTAPFPKPLAMNGHGDPDLELRPVADDDAYQQLAAMVKSGEYWVVPVVGPLSAQIGHRLVQEVEEARRSGRVVRSGDVRELQTPDVAMRLLVVKRSALPRQELAALAAAVTGHPQVAALVDRALAVSPVLMLVGTDEGPEVKARAQRLFTWLREGGPFPTGEA